MCNLIWIVIVGYLYQLFRSTAVNRCHYTPIGWNVHIEIICRLNDNLSSWHLVFVCASWKSAEAVSTKLCCDFFLSHFLPRSLFILLVVFGVVCCCDELFNSCLRVSVIRMVNMIFFSLSKPIWKYVKQRLLWVIHSHFSIWWTFFGSMIQLSIEKFGFSRGMYVCGEGVCMCGRERV